MIRTIGVGVRSIGVPRDRCPNVGWWEWGCRSAGPAWKDGMVGSRVCLQARPPKSPLPLVCSVHTLCASSAALSATRSLGLMTVTPMFILGRKVCMNCLQARVGMRRMA